MEHSTTITISATSFTLILLLLLPWWLSDIKKPRSEILHNLFHFQLRIPTELHAAGSVGDRVRDDGRQHPADHPTEQEPLPGPPTGVTRGIVSTTSNKLICIFLIPPLWTAYVSLRHKIILSKCLFGPGILANFDMNINCWVICVFS